MKPGMSKAKGSSFERQICKVLSLWVSNDEREDIFWRSAMSGGRATVARKKGKFLQTSAGDMTAVHPLGILLTDHFLIECKHVKNLNLHRFVTEHSGMLAEFWENAYQQAIDHRRKPMLICKQNQYPILLLVSHRLDSYILTGVKPKCVIRCLPKCHIYIFSDLLERRFSIRGA